MRRFRSARSASGILTRNGRMLSDVPAVTFVVSVPDCASTRPVRPNWAAPVITAAFRKNCRRLYAVASDVLLVSNVFVVFIGEFLGSIVLGFNLRVRSDLGFAVLCLHVFCSLKLHPTLVIARIDVGMATARFSILCSHS